jgi:hypothetical protein
MEKVEKAIELRLTTIVQKLIMIEDTVPIDQDCREALES